MSFLAEFFRALAVVGIPVFVLTYALAWWGLKRGLFSETGGLDALNREIKALGKLEKGQRSGSNPLHDKWFRFGGGFYGVMALLTYVLVEWGEVRELLGRLDDLVLRFDIGVLVTFFISSLTNFIAAVTWPVYWVDIARGHLWTWFITAYAAYWVATRLAQSRVASRQRNEP